MIERNKIFAVKLVYAHNCIVDEKLFNDDSTQIVMSEKGNLRINKSGYVVLDFGAEYCGLLHLVYGENFFSGTIRVRLGESVAEACAEIGENGAGNNHSLRDLHYPIISHSEINTSESGFRFARIDLTEGESCVLKTAYIESKSYGEKKRGFFRCDDEQLNRIYEIAERTATLCVQGDIVWDGVKRDRTVWVGDFHPEMCTLAQTYGVMPHFERVLDYARIFVERGAWVNNIPSYSAWWIVCLYEYYFLSGNAEYVTKQLPYLRKILADFNAIVLENGEVDYTNSSLFACEDSLFYVDWCTKGTSEEKLAWATFVAVAARCAQKLLMCVNESFEDATRLYSCLSKVAEKESTFKHIQAFRFFAELRESDGLAEFLTRGGAEGLSGFMSYYILDAAAKSGANEELLPIIKDYFGGMLRFGATSFWEDFDVLWLNDSPQSLEEMPRPDYKNVHRDYGKYCYKGFRHSLCHGWSSGVATFLARNVLGVQPFEAGYRVVKITPKLLGLQFAEGVVPTPYGDIYVRHEQKEGKIVTEYRLPKGVTLLK